MSKITLDVPNESLLALRATPEIAGERLLLAAAVKLYEMGELSSGAAAHLAGIPRVVFLSKLADFGVDTFRLTEGELRRETRLAWVHLHTSPLQYLHQLELLSILPSLTGGVVIPDSVADELAEGLKKGGNVPAPQSLPWVTICRTASASGLPLAGDLGKGEAGVLALALESKDAVVIIDDGWPPSRRMVGSEVDRDYRAPARRQEQGIDCKDCSLPRRPDTSAFSSFQDHLFGRPETRWGNVIAEIVGCRAYGTSG
jgi:predicted HTH domain antitoxin